jgi:hypothetical protein
MTVPASRYAPTGPPAAIVSLRTPATGSGPSGIGAAAAPSPLDPAGALRSEIVALRADLAALQASVNTAIVGLQSSIDGIARQVERIQRRAGADARRSSEHHRIVADHVASLWRAIDGAREATNWCWAFATPHARGVVQMRERLIGHEPAVQQHQQGHETGHGNGDHAMGQGHDGGREDGDREYGGDREHPSSPVLDVPAPPGRCFFVRFPMVKAPDEAGASCAWMRTLTVCPERADMKPYWIRVHDLDANISFLDEFTNVPPVEPHDAGRVAPLYSEEDAHKDDKRDWSDEADEGDRGEEAERAPVPIARSRQRPNAVAASPSSTSPTSSPVLSLDSPSCSPYDGPKDTHGDQGDDADDDDDDLDDVPAPQPCFHKQ